MSETRVITFFNMVEFRDAVHIRDFLPFSKSYSSLMLRMGFLFVTLCALTKTVGILPGAVTLTYKQVVKYEK